ncbi:MAG: hypothetical protein LBK61_10450 [Spirochaetaceae bacterium]|nr:hypothetical protein [Spirochaetaceae bacterium]
MKKKRFPKTKRFSVFGLPVVLLAFGLVLARCDTGEDPAGGLNSPANTAKKFLSGFFLDTKGNKIYFELDDEEGSSGTSASVTGGAISRAVDNADDGYDLSGVLGNDGMAIRLRGSYDPDSGNWSVSARTAEDAIFTIDGSVDSAGAFLGAGATIVMPDEGVPNEWAPSFAPVTKNAAAWSPAGDIADSKSGGMPDFAHGYWNGSWKEEGLADFPGASAITSVRCIISDWKIKITGTETRVLSSLEPLSDGEVLINQNQTVIEVEKVDDNTYLVTSCYPEYIQTGETFVAAITDYLDLNEGDIELRTNSIPSLDYENRWVYMDSMEGIAFYGGLAEEEYEKMWKFYTTNAWEAWAAEQPEGTVEMNKKYAQYKFVFETGNSSFKMVRMIKWPDPGDGDLKQGYTVYHNTYAFDTLAELTAAATAADPKDQLHEEHKLFWPASFNGPYYDAGVFLMPFTRN